MGWDGSDVMGDLVLRSLVYPMWALLSHHTIHTLHAMYAFLAHIRALAYMQAAEFASFLQDDAYGEQQDADCANYECCQK